MRTLAPRFRSSCAWKLLLTMMIAGGAWGAEALLNDRVREAAERGLARIQASQNLWYSRQGCHSCHYQFLPELAYRAAREHGLRFDEAAASAAARQTFQFYSNLDRAIQFTHIPRSTTPIRCLRPMPGR